MIETIIGIVVLLLIIIASITECPYVEKEHLYKEDGYVRPSWLKVITLVIAGAISLITLGFLFISIAKVIGHIILSFFN